MRYFLVGYRNRLVAKPKKYLQRAVWLGHKKDQAHVPKTVGPVNQCCITSIFCECSLMSVCTCPFAHYAGLLSLTLLELSGNLLSSVPTHLPPSIQQLYLSNNSLSQLGDGSFSGLSGLKYLRLSRCGLQSSGLHPQVFNLPSLVELDLSYNKLAAVPTVPTSLQYLYLEANEIKGEVM